MVLNDDNNIKKEDIASDSIIDFLKKAKIAFAGPLHSFSPPEEEENNRDIEEKLKHIQSFNLKPEEIKKYLDRFIIGQEEAKKTLAVSICDHYNHIKMCIKNPEINKEEYLKHNILLLGPTGVGKTYMIKCIARLIGVPFVKADATKFSETGYVGRDVEDLVRDLVRIANGSIEIAQYGIIYLDEIDKIATTSGHIGRDVSGRGVQINLLKLMEETEVNLFSQTDIIGQMQAIFEMQRKGKLKSHVINTRHILFIVSGAFDGLVDIVKRRVESNLIGFGGYEHKKFSDSDYLNMATTKDFIDFGFEPEFIGRLPVRIVCNPLTKENLEEILTKAEGNILEQYKRDFKGYDIELEVTKEAISAFAEKAYKEKTGARGLMTVMERVLREFKYFLPSTNFKKLTVTREMVENPLKAAEDLVNNSIKETARKKIETEIAQHIQRFKQEYGIQLEISPPALNELILRCIKNNITFSQMWQNDFKDLEYGIQLVSNHKKTNIFKITKAFLNNPDKYITEQLIETN